jgi:hypothetical protein
MDELECEDNKDNESYDYGTSDAHTQDSDKPEDPATLAETRWENAVALIEEETSGADEGGYDPMESVQVVQHASVQRRILLDSVTKAVETYRSTFKNEVVASLMTIARNVHDQYATRIRHVLNEVRSSMFHNAVRRQKMVAALNRTELRCQQLRHRVMQNDHEPSGSDLDCDAQWTQDSSHKEGADVDWEELIRIEPAREAHVRSVQNVQEAWEEMEKQYVAQIQDLTENMLGAHDRFVVEGIYPIIDHYHERLESAQVAVQEAIMTNAERRHQMKGTLEETQSKMQSLFQSLMARVTRTMGRSNRR